MQIYVYVNVCVCMTEIYLCVCLSVNPSTRLSVYHLSTYLYIWFCWWCCFFKACLCFESLYIWVLSFCCKTYILHTIFEPEFSGLYTWKRVRLSCYYNSGLRIFMNLLRYYAKFSTLCWQLPKSFACFEFLKLYKIWDVVCQNLTHHQHQTFPLSQDRLPHVLVPLQSAAYTQWSLALWWKSGAYSVNFDWI